VAHLTSPSGEQSCLPFFLGCASVADKLSWSVSSSLRTRIFRVAEPRKVGRCSIRGASSVGTQSETRRSLVVRVSAPRPAISQPENITYRVRIIQARLSKFHYNSGKASEDRWTSWWLPPACGCRRVTVTDSRLAADFLYGSGCRAARTRFGRILIRGLGTVGPGKVEDGLRSMVRSPNTPLPRDVLCNENMTSLLRIRILRSAEPPMAWGRSI
jgi:hypothetical protein